MYKTMIIFDDHKLLEKLKKLPIWGDISDFELTTAINNSELAEYKMQQTHYDLIVVQADAPTTNGLHILNYAKQEKLCEHVVLYSEELNYVYARKAIILGAFDYFINPCDEDMFFSVFNRIKSESYNDEDIENRYISKLMKYFRDNDKDIYKYMPTMLDEVYTIWSNPENANEKLNQICEIVIDNIFTSNDWLNLYVDKQNFNISEGENNSAVEKIGKLFEEYCELFPNVNNEKLRKTIVYILNNPEGKLKQKTIAANLYINSSFFSIMFTSQTKYRFVDYLMNVKLKRAGLLLKETNMTVAQIATKLDYKDTSYFSRLFKKKYGLTPSEYRIPEGYDYQI